MKNNNENIETCKVGSCLRVCYLGETCGIVKLIPESASRKRSSLALDKIYLWN